MDMRLVDALNGLNEVHLNLPYEQVVYSRNCFDRFEAGEDFHDNELAVIESLTIWGQAMKLEHTLQKLEPIKHRLNDPLFKNANYLIKKMNKGKSFSEYEEGHAADLLKVAEGKK